MLRARAAPTSWSWSTRTTSTRLCCSRDGPPIAWASTIACSARGSWGPRATGGMPLYKYVANRVLTRRTGFAAQALRIPHRVPRVLPRVLEGAAAPRELRRFRVRQSGARPLAPVRVGEVTCPTKYFPEASSINFRSAVFTDSASRGRRSVRATRLHRWGVPSAAGSLGAELVAGSASRPSLGCIYSESRVGDYRNHQGVRQLLGPRSIWNTGEAEAIGPIVNEVDGIRMIPPADDEVPLGHVNLAVASERESPAINWSRSFIDRRLKSTIKSGSSAWPSWL